jgi:hypothetical protein
MKGIYMNAHDTIENEMNNVYVIENEKIKSIIANLEAKAAELTYKLEEKR